MILTITKTFHCARLKQSFEADDVAVIDEAIGRTWIAIGVAVETPAIETVVENA